jgi:hypothetical protein
VLSIMWSDGLQLYVTSYHKLGPIPWSSEKSQRVSSDSLRYVVCTWRSTREATTTHVDVTIPSIRQTIGNYYSEPIGGGLCSATMLLQH